MRLPQFGMGMSEAQIIQWLKNEGDAVSEGEPLVEIESEKSTVEVAAPVSGRLVQILTAVGETVPVYDVMALIEEA
jgi:pyruvate/2-oxoglutarate dehydrogenase complex dihydrolipoamide acyltransferase (E2) component